MVEDLQILQELKKIKHVEFSAVRSSTPTSSQLGDALAMAARVDREQLSTATLFGRHFEQVKAGKWERVSRGDGHRRSAKLFAWAREI